VDPVICIERITARGEKVQAHENIEKLTKLRKAYHLVCDVVQQTLPVLRLAGDESLEKLTEEAVAFIRSADNETN
ncbi:MAG: hypothetical protein KJN98_04560, partial [Pontiella sp.]|nr:hypothetical protein [Pontiella sp.]